MNIVPLWASAAMVLSLAPWAGLVALLFWSKRRIQMLRQELAEYEVIPQTVSELASELKQAQIRLAELEETRSAMPEWHSEPAVNLNRRGQVLRLYRRGEAMGQIASLLGLSHGEVKLIIKVHELSRAGAEAEKPEQAGSTFAGIFR